MVKQWQHNPIGQKAGAPLADGDLWCYAWEHDRTQHVVYRGNDNQVHELWLRKGHTWGYGGALSLKLGAPPLVGNPYGYAWEGDGTQHVIYRSPDNQIHELWQRKGQEWKYGGALNARLQAPPAAGDPNGFAWESDHTQHIIYRGEDSQVHELWQRKGQEWKYGGVLSQKAGAPSCVGEPLGFAWEDDGTQHILYRDASGSVIELWQRKGGNWNYEGALSRRAGAPEAASDPFGFAWEGDHTQHIIYRGNDNQVHELWLRKGSGWKYGGALSLKAGGPPAVGDPIGFAWESDHTQHIIYRGEDNLVHELWQRRGQEWEYGGALSGITGAPPAFGEVAAFAWEDDNTQHIIYRAADNQIHEIWYRK